MTFFQLPDLLVLDNQYLDNCIIIYFCNAIKMALWFIAPLLKKKGMENKKIMEIHSFSLTS